MKKLPTITQDRPPTQDNYGTLVLSDGYALVRRDEGVVLTPVADLKRHLGERSIFLARGFDYHWPDWTPQIKLDMLALYCEWIQNVGDYGFAT